MADLKGRDVIPASTWPDMTPPLAAGWPGKVTEYMTGGSTSRGGRDRRWGVMADVDIADPQHNVAPAGKSYIPRSVALKFSPMSVSPIFANLRA
jgi:hypothetical protein